ncbi:MAG TPA: hypothetical protein VJZ71_15450 [Phycisphaerae bacterium]|nr:hypothetical protein [Phycisphaerae bacterium]
MPTHPCPKCGRQLNQSGEAAVDERVYPIYQCDECIVVTEFMGRTIEMALTFALGDDGKPFDPASPDGHLSL